MPNTLAHLGIQALATRAIVSSADLKWICLGCIIPDIPWILQRIIGPLNIAGSLYDLRLYVIVQSSLAMSLIICAALAACSSKPRMVFIILSFNALLHLVLDALQIKWANGVHLLAPFSWQLLNFGLFWPESLPTVLLTILGLVFVLYAWSRRPGTAIDLFLGPRTRIAFGISMLITYLLLPIAFLPGPEAADNHSIQVLRAKESRPGQDVQFDRNMYIRDEGGDKIWTFVGEELNAVGVRPDRSGTTSARGRFVDKNTVELLKVKSHAPYLRDLASIIGLFLVALIWGKSLWDNRSTMRSS